MFIAAIASRNSAETSVPITRPTLWNASNRSLKAVAVAAIATDAEHHNGRVAEREEKANRDRPLAFLHQLAGDVVDCCDVVGIDGVAQAEAISQQRSAKQHRVMLNAARAQAQAATFAAIRTA